MVTSRGIRSDFRFDLNIPTLSGSGYREFVLATQKMALPKGRRRIVTPARKRFPRNTGTLRKRFRATRVRNRNFSRDYFTMLTFKFPFYAYFQERAWEQFRQQIVDEANIIAVESVAEALKAQGFR